MADGVELISGGLYSSAFSCYLPFTSSESGTFFFRGSQPHGTVLHILKICLDECPEFDEEKAKDCYAIPGEPRVVYISAVRRKEFGLEDDRLFGTQTWGDHPTKGTNPIIGEESYGHTWLPVERPDEDNPLTESAAFTCMLANATYCAQRDVQTQSGRAPVITTHLIRGARSVLRDIAGQTGPVTTYNPVTHTWRNGTLYERRGDGGDGDDEEGDE